VIATLHCFLLHVSGWPATGQTRSQFWGKRHFMLFWIGVGQPNDLTQLGWLPPFTVSYWPVTNLTLFWVGLQHPRRSHPYCLNASVLFWVGKPFTLRCFRLAWGQQDALIPSR